MPTKFIVDNDSKVFGVILNLYLCMNIITPVLLALRGVSVKIKSSEARDAFNSNILM